MDHFYIRANLAMERVDSIYKAQDAPEKQPLGHVGRKREEAAASDSKEWY